MAQKICQKNQRVSDISSSCYYFILVSKLKAGEYPAGNEYTAFQVEESSNIDRPTYVQSGAGARIEQYEGSPRKRQEIKMEGIIFEDLARSKSIDAFI